MRPGRPRLATALGSIAALAVVGLVPAAPSAAEPSIDDVQTRVDTLYRDAEKASERFNTARLELASLRTDLKGLRATEKRRLERLDVARRAVEDSVVRQYEGDAVSGVSRVLVSEDPQSFLEQLATMDAYGEMQQSLFDDFAAQVRTVRKRESRTAERVQRLADVKAGLAQDKAVIDDKLGEAEVLLGRLEEEKRQREAARAAAREPEVSRSAPRAPAPAPAPVSASGSAAAAVQFAQAQVGDSYVYGASGPSSWDCSGLTAGAWAAAGVSLPHSSTAQYSMGRKVSSSDLQPGDLVFYYQPISHVGIYVGNGMIVHAANPSTGVSTASVFSMPFSGATRPG